MNRSHPYYAGRPVRPRISPFARIAYRIPGAPMSRSDFGASVFAVFGLFFFSGTLVVLLTAEGAESSPMVQFFGLTIGLVSLVDYMLRPGALNRLFGLYWPVMIPILFACASITWSVEPMLTARRLAGLIFATSFALWLTERFMRQGLFPVIAGAAMSIVVANVVVAVAIPSMGVHPALTEIGDPNPHVGAWRGLFDHKNDFGRMMALCILILWIAFFSRRSWRPAVGLSLLIGYVGVLGSTSGQAALLAVAIPGIVLSIAWLRPLPAAKRAMAVLIAGPSLVVIYILSQIVIAFVLGLLGKDPSLTGRTEIWLGTLRAIEGNMALGGGYGAGWNLVGERLFLMTGIDVGHAHNGYLDLVTDLGGAGLVVMALFYLTLLIAGIRAFYANIATETALLAIGVAAFALIGNWVASFLILHNSLYWVLPIVCFVNLMRAFRPIAALNPIKGGPPVWSLASRPPKPGSEIKLYPARPTRKSAT